MQVYLDWLHFFLIFLFHGDRKNIWMLRESNPGKLAPQAIAQSITPWPLGQEGVLMCSILLHSNPVLG